MWFYRYVCTILSKVFLKAIRMESSTLLKLELDTSRHQEFVFNTIQSLRMSDYNLLISCADGGTVFTNKKYLGVFSALIKDICEEFREQETLTLNVQFSKQHVEMMLEYFNTGQLKSDDAESLNEVLSLLQVFGVNTDKFELIEVMPARKKARKIKSEALDPLTQKTIKKNREKVMKSELQQESGLDSTLDENVALDWQPDDENDDKCEHCGKGFPTPSRLTAHLVTHTKVKPFECKECGKFFSSQGALYNHAGVHNPSKCEHCDRTFAQKASLKNHMQTCRLRGST